MTIEISAPKSLEELAVFLEVTNNKDTLHIGYCGEKEKEIFDTLSNDFSDLDIEKSFVVAYDQDILVAALGFDIDEERKSAEVWGPFDNGKGDHLTANALWEALENTTPFKLNKYQFFVNEKNTFARQFCETKKVIESGHHLILSVKRDNQTSKDLDIHIMNYTPSYFQSFSALHTLAFPNTYYSSEEIISRLNEDNRLFVFRHNNVVKGFVYVEANPLQGEGAIEYIVVSPEFRGQGIAKKLMKAALHHLFSYKNIEEITLSVEDYNKTAIALYMASGFHVKHTLIAYEKRK